MRTHYTDDPAEAAAYLRQGQLVAFPTETVYGLGADVFNEQAVRRIFEAKGRPSDNPLIAHVADAAGVQQVASAVSDTGQRLIRAFFPGPLTVVLPKRSEVPDAATGGLPTIGVRMPRHDLSLALLAAAGTPLVAPSANLSGRPSPTSWEAVAADLDGRIACVLKGGRTEAGIESTVVDCTTDVPVVLRPGAVTLEELRQVVPSAIAASTDPHLLRKSPGTSYRHYSPRAQVVIVAGGSPTPFTERSAYLGITAPPDEHAFDRVRVCSSVAEYAHELFAFFREADEARIRIIYCEEVPAVGLGAALMDRISRAAEG